MYLIELIIKNIFKRKKQENIYNPLEASDEEDEYIACEHIFMPIDSTGEILACTLCGKIVNKKDLQKENIFVAKEMPNNIQNDPN